MPIGLFAQYKVSKLQLKRVLQIFTVIEMCFLLYGFLVLVLFNPVDYSTDVAFVHLRHLFETTILFMHPVYIGLTCAITFIIALYLSFISTSKWMRVFFLFCAGINIVMIFFLASRAALLGVLLATAFMFFKMGKGKYFLYLFMGFILTSIVVQANFKGYRLSEIYDFGVNFFKAVSDPNNTIGIRYHIYKCALTLIGYEPFMGYGIGDIHNVLNVCLSEYIESPDYNAHNQYLEILLTSGAMGLVLFAGFLRHVFTAFKRQGNILGLTLLLFFTINFITENIYARSRGVFLFSYFVFLLYYGERIVKNEY
jgi:O-antigen ligase